MKIATYKVNGINALLPILLRWLEIEKQYIVCLQELKAPDEKIPKQEIANAGYKAIWNGQKRWNRGCNLYKGFRYRRNPERPGRRTR